MSDLLHLVGEQKDFEFCDLVSNGPDNPVFIDGLLIGENKDEYSVEYSLTIDDFYHEIFKKIESKPIDQVGLLRMFLHSSEINATRLGTSKVVPNQYSVGKGCSPKMLYSLFTRPEILDIAQTKVISECPTNVNLFINGFDKDRMNDLLSSIGFKVLCKFTEDQVKMAEAKTGKKVKCNPIPQQGYYWNYKTHNWDTFNYTQYLDKNNKPFTLVPKNMVTGFYVYSAKRYIRGYMLVQVQEQKLTEARELDPTASKIRIDELEQDFRNKLGIESSSYKDFLRKYATKYPNEDFLSEFRKSDSFRNVLSYSGRLKDEQLTSIILKPYRELLKEYE